MPLLRPGRRPVGAVAALLFAIGAPGAPAIAQGRPSAASRIAGAAVSTDGEHVVGAEVRVIGVRGPGAVTRDDGSFELFVTGDTLPRLVVRRIGFEPETLTVALPQASTPALIVQLVRVVQTLRPVVVSATSAESNTTMALVRERQRTRGNGYVMFSEQFMKNNPVQFTDILRRVPGVQLIRTPGNTATVRLRENRCTPLFWMDGQPLAGIPFDPNTLPPSTIEAIEVYSSPSLVPAQFQGPMYAQGCGSVVIWTRHGEFRARQQTISADSIARLIDAQRIFVAAEVDKPARIRALPQPEYPDSLRAAGVSGSAVIEFIIEANGSLNKESIGIVSATHTAFADAVRIAVLEAEFSPAMKAERTVAQVYQLPVIFDSPKRP